MPKNRKELMFFDSTKVFDAGLDQYADYFQEYNGESACGEVTPGYFWTSPEYSEWGGADPFRQGIPDRVRDFLGPDVKLVLQLRNPIDRALSAFLHHREKGRFDQDVTIGSVLKMRGIAHIGFYGAHLAHWLKSFPRENMFIVSYEELFGEQGKPEEIVRFLGAKPVSTGGFTDRKVRAGLGFSRTEQGVTDGLGRVVATADDIQFLQRLYADDVQRLRELSGLPFSEWKADF